MGKSDKYRQRVMIVHVRLANLTPIPEESNEETRRNERGNPPAPAAPVAERRCWSRALPMREEEPGPSGLPETPTLPNENGRDGNGKPT